MSFSRRDFLKSSAVAVAAMSANQAFALEKKVKTIPHASNLGAFYADVDESGRIVKYIRKNRIKTRNIREMKLGEIGYIQTPASNILVLEKAT